MPRRRATRTVLLSDADRLKHVHPRWKRNGPTHVCDGCGAEFWLRREAAFAVGMPGVGCRCGGRIVAVDELAAHAEHDAVLDDLDARGVGIMTGVLRLLAALRDAFRRGWTVADIERQLNFRHPNGRPRSFCTGCHGELNDDVVPCLLPIAEDIGEAVCPTCYLDSTQHREEE